MYALTFIAYAAAVAVVDGPQDGAVEESREVYEIAAATTVPVASPRGTGQALKVPVRE